MLRLIIVYLVFFAAMSTWLRLSSAYSDQDTCDKRLDEEIRQEELQLDRQLIGLGKEEVIARLGKPRPKNVKAGEHKYLIDRDCFGPSCETSLSDEVWFYEFEKQIPSCGRYAYSIIIYFLNGKVVRVG